VAEFPDVGASFDKHIEDVDVASHGGLDNERGISVVLRPLLCLHGGTDHSWWCIKLDTLAEESFNHVCSCKPDGRLNKIQLLVTHEFDKLKGED